MSQKSFQRNAWIADYKASDPKLRLFMFVPEMSHASGPILAAGRIEYASKRSADCG